VVGLVPFQGGSIKSWKNLETGKVYVMVADVCKTLGVTVRHQRLKLTHNRLYRGAIERCGNAPLGQGSAPVLGLELSMLPTWLLSISAEKVCQEKQDLLLAYQRESAAVLND
jgi:hypothetical protein